MSVLVKGMKMPKDCDECRMKTDEGFCSAMPKEFCGYADEQKPQRDYCQGRENSILDFSADTI